VRNRRARPKKFVYTRVAKLGDFSPKKAKERGFFSTYYTYITVFIRNAANLTLLLLKGSKLRKGNKN
jgi:hypothetical protein